MAGGEPRDVATSRTSTPAAKRRAASRKAARGAPRRGQTSTPRPKPKAKPAAKRPTPKRTAAKRPPAKRTAVKGRRAPAKGSRPRKPAGRTRALPSLRTSLIVVAALALVLVGGYFAWLRNSSLVAVTEVEVGGLSSPDAPQIEEALTKAAADMTTLNVDQARLEKAVAGFPTVVSVSADPDLLHGLAITVNERPPALIAKAKDAEVPVSADGTLLTGLDLGEAAEGFPVLPVDQLPGSGKLEGEALAQAMVLGGAPAPLRPLIEGIAIEGERGVEVTMRGDIPIRFGTSENAAAKWAAAAAVLSDPKLETLTYVDVRVPQRPAVGGAATPPAAEEPVVTEEPVEPTL